MKVFFVALFLMICPVPLISQSYEMLIPGDPCHHLTVMEERQIRQLDSLYLALTGTARQFVYGKDFIPYYNRTRSKPLLRYDDDRTGTVDFSGRVFGGVTLQYDTYTDQVIFSDNTLIYDNRFYSVALNRHLIRGFNLFFNNDTLAFRFLTHQVDSTFNLPDRYYEIVRDSRCKLLVRHYSTCSYSDGVDSYYYSPSMFVNVSGIFVPVGNRRQFLELFGERSDEVKHYMQSNGIKLRRAGKKQISNILGFYENICRENQ